MHELSVALEICRIAEGQVGTEGLRRVREVGVSVGRGSGVEPGNLLFCLEALLERSPFAGARAALEIDPGDDLRVTYLEVDDAGTTH